MRILHVGAAASPNVVDGVNAMVWLTATEQARLGHDVTLLIDRSPDESVRLAAAERGLGLVYAPTTALYYDKSVVDGLMSNVDVAHLHSVFIPRHITLARRLVREGIPYVVTPHGGLSPQVLRRGRLKKWIFSLLAERPRMRKAAAISVVVPGEVVDVRAFTKRDGGTVSWIPNPVDPSAFDAHPWHWRETTTPRVVFLGRFDVLHKGLDLMWAIARRLPEVQFDLYGNTAHRAGDWFEQLQAQKLPNVNVLPPVYGDEKTKVLSEASLYLQTSRWEGFPVSIAEAMLVGLPVAVAERLHVGKQFQQNDLGPVFPADAEAAASVIWSALSNRDRLVGWSERARAFAVNNFTPREVAGEFIDLYRQVLASRRKPSTVARPMAVSAVRN